MFQDWECLLPHFRLPRDPRGCQGPLRVRGRLPGLRAVASGPGGAEGQYPGQDGQAELLHGAGVLLAGSHAQPRHQRLGVGQLPHPGQHLQPLEEQSVW